MTTIDLHVTPCSNYKNCKNDYFSYYELEELCKQCANEDKDCEMCIDHICSMCVTCEKARVTYIMHNMTTSISFDNKKDVVIIKEEGGI